MKDNKENGCYKNLENQVNSIMKNCNEGSIRTRYRYLEATKRCCEFLANEYKLSKFSNLSSKHIISYSNYLSDKGLKPSTIKTELCGVRYFHRHSGSKNILIDNSKLNLTPREYGKVNRAWLPEEIRGAIECGKYYGRMDFVFAVKFCSLYNLRLNCLCSLTVNSIESCRDTGELVVKGKGGRIRYIPMNTPEKKALIVEALQYAKENNLRKTDYLISDNRKGGVEAERKSLENFLYNHKEKFINSEARTYIVGSDTKNSTKIRSSTLTIHGLRATAAQDYYNYLKNERKDLSEREIKLRTSEFLGHSRYEISRIYLD